MNKQHPFANLCKWITAGVVLFLVLPLITMIVFSFSKKIEVIPSELTLKWYGFIGHDALAAIGISFMISLPAILIALLVSLPLAYVMTRTDFPGKKLIDQLIILPALIPGTVFGLSLLQLFNTGFFRGTPPLLVLILAHTAVVVPVMARPILAAMEQLGSKLEEAAETLGATPIQAFLGVTFPLISSSIVVGMIFGFARSINDFIMTFFLMTPDLVPLSIRIFTSTYLSVPQITAANAVVLVTMSVGVVLLAERCYGGPHCQDTK
ncbi:ABC transporter permease [Moorella naiadis]|uniref:ABC transporter permease n=1 Tax=Moorella naiadis (nom. illeg.) TaxID=3093670 RepID=UPI003D9C97F8